MSEFGKVHKLVLPGLLRVLLVLAGGTGSQQAHAAGLGMPTSVFLHSRAYLAQASEQAGASTAPDGPGDPSGQLDEDVPFSELNEALSAARSRLAELTKAAEIAKVAGELQKKLQAVEGENRQLKSVLSQLQTDFSELQSVKQTSEGRVGELEQTSQAAVAEAKRLSAELSRVQSELGARDESLTAAAEGSAIEIAKLQNELDAARERILVAERERVENAAELNELRQATEDTTSDRAKLAKNLDGTITELADTRTELSATEEELEATKLALQGAEQETGVLREQLSSNRSDLETLREQLESAENDLKRARTVNAGLERQVGVLKAAAGEATNAARQNLLAVEDQIDEINAALASVRAEELLEDAAASDSQGTAPLPESRTAAAAPLNDQTWVPRPSPPRATIQEASITASATNRLQTQAARELRSGSANGRPGGENATDQTPAINLASLTTDLPVSQRQDAATLLDKVKAEKREQGLSMTVPGELLFAVNGENIEPAAIDALANVAKLVDLYGQRDVLIIGHTDAVGDAEYNQRLSERRAELVKKFFIDEFEISADRMQIEGKGEQDPINSNATADGRNANRRVEVVILD